MTNEEREYAIEVFENALKCNGQQRKHICDRKCYRCGVSRAYRSEELEEAINTALEALKQEPREHGEWIYCDDSVVINLRSIERIYHKCSKCGNREYTSIEGFNFCPKCGADMRKQEGIKHD